MNKYIQNFNRQQGAVLITSLVFMAILTLMGISAMRANLMDVRIHNSMKDRGNAFQCAEAAIRQGENHIFNANAKPDDTSATPNRSAGDVWVVNASTLKKFLSKDSAWWAANTWSDFVLSDPNAQIGCANAANFVVEDMGILGNDADESRDLSFTKQMESQMSGYRITSRSEGVSDKAKVILQTTFYRRFQ
ncbi:MAG: PilX N-terminal domain-containing pilus assembly protein [Gammaproteobacteria bacterium]|nr:PilX N-terminal domain-containing pilus assembly protein [Gammaproteobacteria bacterium]